MASKITVRFPTGTVRTRMRSRRPCNDGRAHSWSISCMLRRACGGVRGAGDSNRAPCLARAIPPNISWNTDSKLKTQPLPVYFPGRTSEWLCWIRSNRRCLFCQGRRIRNMADILLQSRITRPIADAAKALAAVDRRRPFQSPSRFNLHRRFSTTLSEPFRKQLQKDFG